MSSRPYLSACLCALLLASHAFAQKAKTDKSPKPDRSKESWSLDAPQAPAKGSAKAPAGSADQQRLDAAQELFKNNDHKAAALAAYEIANEQGHPDVSLEAQQLLGKSLYRVGLSHSALTQFAKLLAKGPQTKQFKNALEWVVFVSHKTANESVALDEIARYADTEFPDRFRTELYYLLAGYLARSARAADLGGQKAQADKSFDDVRRLAQQIPRSDAFYARAKYLEGIAHFRKERWADSLEAMKEVIRLTRPGTKRTPRQARLDQEVRQLAFMQLARIHYGQRQNRYAVAYYEKVLRGSQQWLESLFEAAWAHYRVGQDEQALGNLVTLAAPFFRDEYFPEAYILRGVIYYENCRYAESSQILDEFEGIYRPVFAEVERMLKQNLDPAEYYNLLEGVEKRAASGSRADSDVILGRVLRLALTDKDLKLMNESILELEAELDAISKETESFRYSSLVQSLTEDLKAQRVALVKKAGTLAKSKLDYETGELKKLITNALRIRFEISTQEKKALEEQLKVAQAKGNEMVEYDFPTEVSEDQLHWPFKGEYWRDELGTYLYTLTKGCAKQRARGPSAGRGED
jgi:hypothetical protein